MYLTALVKDGMIVLKRMNVPLYSSKFSRKDYTIHQHLLCLCIKELQRQSYRDVAEFLDDFNGLQEVLGLKQVPHFTTLQKFLKRFPPRWYKMIHKRLICFIGSHVNAVVDGTGLMQTSASYSYIKRIKRRIKKRDYFKVMLAVDSDDGFILSYYGVHGNRNESPYFIPLLEDIPIEIGDICGDKGFDSEQNQRYITKNSNGCSYLDVRGIPKRGKHRKRVYRQKHEKQWKNKYKQMRNTIESKNYSFKHRFSDFIPGMDIHARRRYLAIRVFTLNLITLQKSENNTFLCSIKIELFYNPPY